MSNFLRVIDKTLSAEGRALRLERKKNNARQKRLRYIVQGKAAVERLKTRIRSDIARLNAANVTNFSLTFSGRIIELDEKLKKISEPREWSKEELLRMEKTLAQEEDECQFLQRYQSFVVAVNARNIHLARTFISGKPYCVAETKIRSLLNAPDFDKIFDTVRRHHHYEDIRTVTQQYSEWEAAARQHIRDQHGEA